MVSAWQTHSRDGDGSDMSRDGLGLLDLYESTPMVFGFVERQVSFG